jgi:peptidoglycan/LPS O-acetylase OafA/YrhL
LTLRRWHRIDNPPLLQTLVRRYFRLGIPIFVSVVIVWLLMTLHLTPTAETSAIVHHEDWLGGFANFEPDPWTALNFALWRVYTVANDRNYGPFLWTMIVEFWGSIVVLTLSQSPRLLREPYSILVLLTIVFLRFYPQAAPMPAGALFAVLQRDTKWLQRTPSEFEGFLASWVAIGLLLAAASIQLLDSSAVLPIGIVGTLLLISVTRSRAAHALLTLPVSAWLGRASFPIYLVQYPILIAPVSFLVIGLHNAGWLNQWSAFSVTIAGTVLVLGAAQLFLPVEVFTLSFVRRIAWPLRTVPVARS